MRAQTTILAAIIALCLSTAAQAKYSGGTGELDDPYLIATAEDMNAIGANPVDWDAHFLLVADINLANCTGTHFNIIGAYPDNPFTSVFDGNDHKVWNFTWIGQSNGGMFRYVDTGGQIKNLGMENIDVNSVPGVGIYYYAGGLVGINEGTIMNCYSTGSVRGGVAGGLVGSNYYYGTIEDCYSDADVCGTGPLGLGCAFGGLVASNRGTITNCYSTGNISGTHDYSSYTGVYVGGLVAHNFGGTITNCYSTSSVSGCSYGGGENYIGGLVARNGYYDNYSTITNCYATGNVSGTEHSSYGLFCIGGLVGGNDGYDAITNCYSTGTVSGTESGEFYVGGLVGWGHYNTIRDSFWDVETSGQTNSAGGTGLPTAQMQTESTFTNAGWDFACETKNGTDEPWTIKEGVDYPELFWQWEDYQEWLTAGKPLCWCCPRQCHGDTDNQKEGSTKGGYYYVHFADLALLQSAWNIKEPNYGDPYPGGPGIAWPDPNICADFDHGIEGSTKSGYWRVHYNDLAILLSSWNIKELPDGPSIEPNCLDCP